MTPRGLGRAAACPVIALFLVGALSPPARVAATPLKRVVAGTEAPGLADAIRIGDASPSAPLSVAVMIPLQNQTELRGGAKSNPETLSRLKGLHLTPSQFAERYGPTPDQLAAVTSYLRSTGLAVTKVWSNGLIDARGNIARVAQAFGTSIGRYHDNGLNRDFFANDSPVSVPAALAPDVLGVAGLDNHFRVAPIGLEARTPTTGPVGGFSPAQLKSGYDYAGLTSSGYTGSAQTVGLFELDGFAQSDIAAYDTQYSLSPPTPTVTCDPVDGCPSVTAVGEREVELDIEVVHALAPAAGITVFEGPNTDNGVLDTYNAMVTSDTTPANSTSWGLCEPALSASFMNMEHNIFFAAAVEGMSFYASSGDYGAYDCTDLCPDSACSGCPECLTSLAVDNPADDSLVTAVGGTHLTLTAGNAYSSETAWSNSGHSPPLGGGGGLSGSSTSTCFPLAAWQFGSGVGNAHSTGCREVPDVASDADPSSGYSVFIEGAWSELGGTSAAAPSWAAYTAIFNQDATAHQKPAVGLMSASLYSNLRADSALHDATVGNNLYYPATANYDYATGLGSYDASLLAHDLLADVGQYNTALNYNGAQDWYYDSTLGALRHTWFNQGQYALETLDGGGSNGSDGRTTTDNVGKYATALIYQGGPQVWYYDVTTHALRHGWWGGTQWNFEILDGAGSGGTNGRLSGDDVGQHAVALLYNGSPQVWYYDATTHALRHGWWGGTQWNFETLDGAGSAGGNGRSTTDDVGQYNALLLYNGGPQVWYSDATTHALRHGWWGGTQWNFEVLDGGGGSNGRTNDNVGQYNAVLLYNGGPQVWYYDMTAHALRHGWWGGNQWNFEVLDGAGSGGGNGRSTTDDVGQATAVLLFSGAPHAWYYDNTTHALRHGWWTGSRWQFEVLDGTGSAAISNGETTHDVGEYAAVTSSVAGNPRVFYFDATGSLLRLGAWTGSQWSFEWVDE